jgi:hypothetical protein
MTDQLPRTPLRCRLDDAALLISALPLHDWPRWVAYLLRSLEAVAQERGDGDAYVEMLADLRSDLTTRLEQSHW